MQVFMPYQNLRDSVCCLDRSRLGNQIWREAYTLIRGGWPNHPAAKIWANHKRRLAQYCLFGLEELKRRGKRYPRWEQYFGEIWLSEIDTGLPDIFGYEPYHASHRSQLLAKNPEWYGQFGWAEQPGELPYVWLRK